MLDKRLRVLALSAYPERMAASRFRQLAYVAPLAELGIDVTFESWLDDATATVLYSPGETARKLVGATRGFGRLLSACRGSWDVAWIQREAILVGPPIIEAGLLGRRVPLVFDVDDAVWLTDSSGSRYKSALKFGWKFDWLIRRAKHVVAGSSALAERSRTLGVPTTVLPTVVSSLAWAPRTSTTRDGEPLTIGWIGTHSTASQLALVAPALQRLRAEGHQFRLLISGADSSFRLPGVPFEPVPWTLASEIELFRGLDIGIAPSFTSAWHEGKCAFKQIQMMSVGVPVVSSWVGGARDFLVHETNALIAHDENDWYLHLRRLLTDSGLRAGIGVAGRALVETQLCVERQAPVLATVLRRAATTHSRDGVVSGRAPDYTAAHSAMRPGEDYGT